MVKVTIDEQAVNKDYPLAHAGLGDARAVLRQLADEVIRQAGPNGRKGDTTAAREVAAVKADFLREWMPRLTSDAVPLSPFRVIWHLMHTVDGRRTVGSHDSGNPRDQIVPFWESLIPHGSIACGTSAPPGPGLRRAVAARVA